MQWNFEDTYFEFIIKLTHTLYFKVCIALRVWTKKSTVQLGRGSPPPLLRRINSVPLALGVKFAPGAEKSPVQMGITVQLEVLYRQLFHVPPGHTRQVQDFTEKPIVTYVQLANTVQLQRLPLIGLVCTGDNFVSSKFNSI